MMIEKTEACKTLRFLFGNGLTAVLSISLSCSFSKIWLKPLAEPVTKKPPKIKQIKVEKLKIVAPKRNPATAEKTTMVESLIFNNWL